MLLCSIYFCELHLMNISFWNVESLSWHLSGRNTLPAILNNLSTAADDAESELR